MIHFVDGPVAGQVLQLERTPTLLRVVIDANGAWDALDQLDDGPDPSEHIIVYRIDGTPGVAFIDYHDRAGRRRGKRIKTAAYRVLPEQPEDEQVRTTEAWRAWSRRWAEAEGITP